VSRFGPGWGVFTLPRGVMGRDSVLITYLLDRATTASFLPDAVAIIGTMDLVFGEVDR
jgi:NADH:ubiquinone oxidoreductase subunit D